MRRNNTGDRCCTKVLGMCLSYGRRLRRWVPGNVVLEYLLTRCGFQKAIGERADFWNYKGVSLDALMAYVYSMLSQKECLNAS